MPAKIAIITYSMYGHVDKLADEVEAGVKSTGAEVTRLQVPETLTDDILQKMHAPPKREFKVLHDPSELLNYDGFLFGFPTRYGRAPAQVSALFDRTGQLWAKGALTGKFAGVFTSTASQHGGQETTALTTVPFFTHHGIIFVPIGYAAGANMTDLSEVIGNSAYGAATIAAGDGSRQPSSKELEIATFQGKHFATILNQFVAGKQSSAPAPARAQPTSGAAAAPVPAGESAAGAKQPEQSQGYDVEQPSSSQPQGASGGAAAGAPSASQVQTPQPAKKPSFFERLAGICGGKKENYEA